MADAVRIDLLSHPRFNAKPVSLTPRERQAWTKFKAEALSKRWMRRSSARHSCGPLFVPKPGTTDLRFVINYAPLNRITRPRVYAPRSDASLRQEITRARWFTKIDLKDAFYHLRIDENDVWKTAFRGPDGLYEMLVLPQGLAQAPGEFQLYIERLLAPVLGENVTAHIDDILVFCTERTACARLTKEVLALLHTHRLAVHPTKSEYVVPTVNYCGFTYGHGTCKPIDISATIRDWPVPRSVSELRQFLGTVNHTAGNVPRFAMIASDLYDATKKDGWAWNAAQSRAFSELRNAVSNLVETREHDPSRNATITTDASLKGVAAILSQQGHVTAIWSRKLSPAERNYDAAERELLAVVEALTRWTHLVEVAPRLKIRTDNEINTHDLRPNQRNRRRNRWIEVVSRYNLLWEHLPGIDNPADAPSRRPDFR